MSGAAYLRPLAPLALALALAGPPHRGQTAPPPNSEEEVRRRAAQVSEIAGKQAGLLDRIEGSRQKVRFSESVLRRAREQKESYQRAIVDGRRRLEELQREEDAARRYLASRMRQRYALGILQEFRVVFAAGGTQDVKDAALYLTALAAEDRRQIQVCRDSRNRIGEARRSMEERQKYLDQVEELARQERALLREELSALTDLLGEVNNERAAARQALDESMAAARKLDSFVEDLSVKKRVALVTQNMADFRGKLPYPAKGRVVAGFGDIVHPRFKTRLPHPGLDISVAEGSPVKAVFGGEVSYAGWLSGYGFTVVLAHPGGYFTVYAHLDQLLARQGDAVTQGETLATGGSGSAAGHPLYFELRRGGEAENPVPWLQAAVRTSRRGKR